MLVITYMHVHVNVCPHMHAGTHRVQRRAADPLALELQGAMSCLTMVLELNSGPLGEQQGSVTAKPSPHPPYNILNHYEQA